MLNVLSNVVSNKWVSLLATYFTKAYYSHELHLRKPTVESFHEVLRQSNLKADETLFIDDNADNILGAQAAGLKLII